jgi:hypothetical protein
MFSGQWEVQHLSTDALWIWSPIWIAIFTQESSVLFTVQ